MKRDTRRIILDAALALFDEHGVSALTQPQIARAAGLRTSHLTYYFPLKADLLAAILDASHRRHGSDQAEDPAKLIRDRQRMRLLLAVILEASESPAACRLVADHLARFEDALAARHDASPEDPAVARLADEVRGAGLRLLVNPEANLPGLDTRAARLGLTPRQGFDDAQAYDGEIRNLVPGYDMVHELLSSAACATLPSNGTMLVAGCGSGQELKRLARVLPGWRFDAVEPSFEMRAAASARLNADGLANSVRLLDDYDASACYDAAVSTLVAHLVSPDSRDAYWNSLGAAVVRDGFLFTTQIETMHASEIHAWCAWAKPRLHPARLELLRHRLHGQAPLFLESLDDTIQRACEVGFHCPKTLFNALGVRTLRLQKSST